MEAIIRATIQSVNEVGFGDTSISKIARLANVSVATLYIYFENKEEMLKKIYLDAKRHMSEHIMQGHDAAAGIRQRYDLFMMNFISFIHDFKDDFMFMEQLSNSPMLRNWCLEDTSAMFIPVLELFKEGRQQHIFKDEEVQLLSLFSIVPVAQFAKASIKGNNPLNEQLVRHVIQMSWDAIAAS